MNPRRVSSLARRVIRQIVRDRRILGLVLLAPVLIITLGAILLRAEPSPLPLGVVDDDEGVTAPVVG